MEKVTDMNKFLMIQLCKLTQEEMENLNDPIILNERELVAFHGQPPVLFAHAGSSSTAPS